MSGDPGFAAVTSLLREVVVRLERIESAIDRQPSPKDRAEERLWTVSDVSDFR